MVINRWIKRQATIEEAEKIEATIKYIEANKDWIRNNPEVEYYGSSSIERTVDILFLN